MFEGDPHPTQRPAQRAHTHRLTQTRLELGDRHVPVVLDELSDTWVFVVIQLPLAARVLIPRGDRPGVASSSQPTVDRRPVQREPPRCFRDPQPAITRGDHTTPQVHRVGFHAWFSFQFILDPLILSLKTLSTGSTRRNQNEIRSRAIHVNNRSYPMIVIDVTEALIMAYSVDLRQRMVPHVFHLTHQHVSHLLGLRHLRKVVMLFS